MTKEYYVLFGGGSNYRKVSYVEYESDGVFKGLHILNDPTVKDDGIIMQVRKLKDLKELKKFNRMHRKRVRNLEEKSREKMKTDDNLLEFCGVKVQKEF